MHTSILFAQQVTAREYKKPASERNSAEYAMKRKEQSGSLPSFLSLSYNSVSPEFFNFEGAQYLIAKNQFRQPM
jgi:hypothetical protein